MVLMKITTIVGVILLALGILSFIYQGITYTTREKIIDLGPIQATAETEKKLQLHPIFGGILIVGGVLLLISGGKKLKPT
jgi:hypothetical membrane protein